MSEARATAALDHAGIDYTIVRHGPVSSLAEAAQLRGVNSDQVIKTLVVRRGKDDYLFVLVPGDRQISWPQLRTLLDVTRLSMPDADTARAVTGYERGTITPFGALHPWPVIAHSRVQGTISMGGGAHGESATANATDVIDALSPTSPRHKHAQRHELRSPERRRTDRAHSRGGVMELGGAEQGRAPQSDSGVMERRSAAR